MKNATAALLAIATLSASAVGAGIETLNLGGAWTLRQADQTDAIDARVPGNVHLDLLRAGRIPDPFYRDNAKDLAWVHESTWVYERTFDAPESVLARDVVLLRCEGLDTVARVELNGELLGDADNMHRTWEFDVRERLRAGPNTLRITFSPIGPYIEDFVRRAPDVQNATGRDIDNVRKASYSNGWDFCQQFLTSGIYRPISLVAYDTARLADVRVAQHLGPDEAELTIDVRADAANDDEVIAEVVISLQGVKVDRASAALDAGAAALKLRVSSPELWWPRGMGAQPLYDVRVDLRDADGHQLDSLHRRIGLRDIRLEPETSDRPLRFTANGRDVFAKGANFVPADVFPGRVGPEKLRRIVADAAAANMNMIRVWGGGYYPDDAFFDACDELGVMVWMDFMFACAPYPGGNPEFQENVHAELDDQVRRLRSHPSIAVLCGNNEVIKLVTDYGVIAMEDYKRLFHDVIGKRVAELAPQANYVGGSPEAGDEHNWWVWHVGADFEHYRQSHGLMTEFGFQSFPVPATVKQYTNAADRRSVLSPINRFHQKNGLGEGNEIILNKLRGYFREPRDFESTLWVSQILQAQGISTGLEHWRTDWPASSGALVWQLNDCWPAPTWASIDFYGRWKAAQYAYRRAFAPVMVTGIPKDGRVPVRIASDLPHAADARVEWRLTDTHGGVVAEGDHELALPAGVGSHAGPELDLRDQIDAIGADRALLWLTVVAAGETHRNLLFFDRPKRLALVDPKLEVRVTPEGDGFEVTVDSSAPALWAWLESHDPDARYSDNFVHIAPGRPATIRVTPSRPTTLDEFRSGLQARSLYDTYPHPEE